MCRIFKKIFKSNFIIRIATTTTTTTCIISMQISFYIVYTGNYSLIESQSFSYVVVAHCYYYLLHCARRCKI